MPVGAVASVATVESHAVPPACLQSARLRPAEPDVLKLYEPVAIVVIAEPKAAVVVAWSASSAAVVVVAAIMLVAEPEAAVAAVIVRGTVRCPNIQKGRS